MKVKDIINMLGEIIVKHVVVFFFSITQVRRVCLRHRYTVHEVSSDLFEQLTVKLKYWLFPV